VEWVQGAEPLSDIIEKYSTKITRKTNNTQRIHKNNPKNNKNDKNNTIKNNKNNTNTNIDISNHIITPQTRDPNPIQEYLRYHNPSEYDEFGICENTMDIFIKSSAGYSVITYLLGVGDRHLDNLMLTPSGHFFHVDYGFLFGRDPKPFRPLVRFSGEMLSAMGGVEHEMYEEFLNSCSKAYNILRRASDSILSMIRLMIQAGIKDLSEKQSPLDALGGVLERFHLQLSDDEADLLIRGIMEHIHRIASTFR
jgi:phosphatidylinositol kinase/protein kinase (PI-3  family)